jgi:polygalacturonase
LSRRLSAALVLLGAGAAFADVPLPLINTNDIINATSYGAVGDGVFTNTIAIQNAINQAAQGGATNGLSGGTVEIPGPGIYLCGPLNMANCVNLQVDAGALLRMLPIDQYPGGTISPANFINGSSLHDIEVSGSGTIDGQGSPWWQDSLTNSSVNRPIMINFSSCSRLLIQNITLSNSPMFHIAIGGSGGNKTVQGVTIRAPSSSDPVNPSHNTDACDVGGTNILVQNCNISVGDDDFTCGGGTHDVLITNNVYGNGHGVSIGSYTDGGVSNITVINCSFNGTDSGFKVKSMRGRGGLVQNIKYINITMTNVDWPISFDAHYEWGLGQHTILTPAFVANNAYTNPAPLTSTTPIIQNILVSNVTAVLSSTRPPFQIWGLPEALASNIVFRSVNITSSAPYPPAVYNATNIQFADCTFNLAANANAMQLWNAGVIFTNSADSPTVNNLWLFDGLTTNLLIYNGSTSNLVGNSLQFFNTHGSLKNTNAMDDGPLTLAASTFTVSNNLSLFPNTVLNFVLSTNPATLAVVGSLTLGGTNNIIAGPGFTNGTYTVMTCSGTLRGSLPALGFVPAGYSCQFDTNTAGRVNLIVVSSALLPPDAPTGLTATATNSLVALNWSPSATATSYNVKRSTIHGGPYTTNATVTATNYSDTQVTNGTTYYYVVSAVNGAGEGTNSAEVSATPFLPPSIVVTTNMFNDVFSSSALNPTTPSAPGANGTGYELISSKSWNPAPSLAAGHLAYGIAATKSGSIEAQALFAPSPVTLATVGDSVSLTVTFTNTSGLLTQSGAMGFGLYNSGQNYSVPGGLNGTATTGSSGNAIGNAQTWAGYVGQIAFTGGNCQVMTRPAQTVGTLYNNDQDLVTSGSGSSSYNFPSGTTVGVASSAPSVTLAAGNPCTEVLTITLTATNTLAITNTLYSGAGTNGVLLSRFGGVSSGATYLTNSFDALAVGWRATATNSATAIDINNIAVTARLSVPTTGNPAPGAPANLTASATNLQINLAWNPVAGATSYNLKRGTVSGSYPTMFSDLTAPHYVDAAVTNAVTYYYVVTAVGAGGESTNSPETSAVPLPSNQPVNILAQVAGSRLQLSWPQDHLGWRLQMQTNNLSAGLGTNWATVSNSTNVITTNLLINPANGSVYYRMIYP